MGRLSSTGTRRFLRVVALSVVAISGLATWALATGPGGWDHLGDRGTPNSDSLDLVASSLHVGAGGALYVGGAFTDAGGIANADRIAKWNGSSWSAVGTSAFPGSSGSVNAIAVAGARVFVGGTFQNAGGNANADFLAVWNGASWAPFCEPLTPGPSFNGNVTSLQIIGETLYVGGEFQNGAGIASADYLLACDLAAGESRTTILDRAPDPDRPFSGSVYALAADSDGTLYAGGGFTNLEDDAAADNVAALPVGGTWQHMDTGGPPCGCAVTGFVRGLTTIGTDVYVGTDANDVAGIVQADHVARWDGSAWHAMGANTGGGNGWFPTTTSIHALTGVGANLFATGSFENANGDARADNVAWFDGSEWHPVGSDGAGGGPWSGEGHALALIDRRLYAAGNFTSAGGDPQAHSVASFSLTQIIAYPTPTVTPGPSAVPTPTVTPGPSAAPTPTVTPTPTPDTTAPRTLLRAAGIDAAKRKATFRFGSGEKGSKFVCKLDKQKYKPCTSPKTYKKLKRGRHVFRVKARDKAGNVDRTPIVKRFKITRR
jgi:hypothetical protein